MKGQETKIFKQENAVYKMNWITKLYKKFNYRNKLTIYNFPKNFVHNK